MPRSASCATGSLNRSPSLGVGEPVAQLALLGIELAQSLLELGNRNQRIGRRMDIAVGHGRRHLV